MADYDADDLSSPDTGRASKEFPPIAHLLPDRLTFLLMVPEHGRSHAKEFSQFTTETMPNPPLRKETPNYPAPFSHHDATHAG